MTLKHFLAESVQEPRILQITHIQKDWGLGLTITVELECACERGLVRRTHDIVCGQVMRFNFRVVNSPGSERATAFLRLSESDPRLSEPHLRYMPGGDGEMLPSDSPLFLLDVGCGYVIGVDFDISAGREPQAPAGAERVPGIPLDAACEALSLKDVLDQPRDLSCSELGSRLQSARVLVISQVQICGDMLLIRLAVEIDSPSTLDHGILEVQCSGVLDWGFANSNPNRICGGESLAAAVWPHRGHEVELNGEIQRPTTFYPMLLMDQSHVIAREIVGWIPAQPKADAPAPG